MSNGLITEGIVSAFIPFCADKPNSILQPILHLLFCQNKIFQSLSERFLFNNFKNSWHMETVHQSLKLGAPSFSQMSICQK